MSKRLQHLLCWILRADPAEVSVMLVAFKRDSRRRAEMRAQKSGLTRQGVLMLIGMYLGLLGLGLAALAFKLRALPTTSALLVFVAGGTLFLGMAFGELYQVLYSDEGYRVIASWPVSSASYLAARLQEPAHDAIMAALLLFVPPSLAMMVFSGTPVLTGTVFGALAILLALGIVLITAGLYVGILHFFGARRTRLIALALRSGTMMAPFLLPIVLSYVPLELLVFEGMPRWFPLTWLVAPIEATTGELQLAESWMIVAGLSGLLFTPWLVLRLTARHYAAGLNTARLQKTESRRPAGIGLDWMRLFLRRPSDRVVVRLFQAHSRHDWRFRAQVMGMVCITFGIIIAVLLQQDAAALFANPLQLSGFWHPAMFSVVLAVWPPILAMPVVLRSADYGASWLLRTGVLSEGELITSARRLTQLLFALPIVVFVGVGYLIFDTPLWDFIRHIAMLVLLSEVISKALWSAFPVLPFSRAMDDDRIANVFMAAGMLLYVLCGLIAILVVHVFYRWTLSYWIGVVWLLFVLRQLRKSSESSA